MHLVLPSAIATATSSGWSVTIDADLTGAAGTDALRTALAATDRHGGGRVEFWVEGATPDDDLWVGAAGLSAYRDLLILRVPLPVDAPIVETRPFEPDDAEAFLRVNNRAFSWHPEQAGMTMADLAARQAEEWYDPDGFRLFEVDGTLAGFCWTKIHRDVDPAEGEIYVIGVDPDHHGQGLGLPLTAAGLHWLSNAGLTVGILYVESDNHAAVRTYEKLGFTRDRVNRAYERLQR